MILFYPRDIGLWRQTFDFSSSAPFKRFITCMKEQHEQP